MLDRKARKGRTGQTEQERENMTGRTGQDKTGVYILENTPPPGGGKNISRCHLGEKI